MACNRSVEYVYHGTDNSVIVNLGAIDSSWKNIQEALCVDGWNADCLPGLMRIFQALVEQNIFCIEFHCNHPKVRWADWFTCDTFMHIKPIAYGISLFSYNELPDAQQAQARKLQKLVSPETLETKIFCVLANGMVINTEDMKDFVLTKPEEINQDYDGLIETRTGAKLLVKVDAASNTVNVAMIIN